MSLEPFYIRPLDEEDLGAVERIEMLTQAQSWSRSAFQEELTHSPPRFFVVDVQGPPRQVVGFGGCRQVMDESYLMNLAIDPSFQRKGFGKLLLSFLMERIRVRGGSVIHLETRANNRAAVEFYKSLGFRVAGIRPRAYPDGGQGLVMMKSLQ